ncbi:2-oxoacid:acceptor oxidoreductase subunit alpha [Pseudodesulfovibrio piezophilus]|uniref:Pyruvate flavodoxin/ferredoxin oxidoreductase domain protein n=1 Tax=Pseudodesulfovibrio piezophilus (strain DSM 21447 / JCM 15486 / C1TLV30) TaxID=1322246 RepID=M1WJ92_PSEP2|nr:2-oxoacid:acceptor oxidoreductase subunit alpha [Pseudodesulfovibrio piezophilus]CCH47491.1 Pyruvate flavodoxin/ferredoxin oxidoreductase domain protein [Pseudodesulfovibrio piezophilus C1TLV30]
MSDTSINIVIGGEAGQGLATIGQLMSKAVTRAGYHLLVNQVYMSRIRGGHNTFAIRVGSTAVESLTEEIDILVALTPETVDLHADKLSSNAVIIAGDDIDTGEYRSLSVPFKALAAKPLFYNTVALGVLAAAVCMDISIVEGLLTQSFKKKGDDVVQANVTVLEAAYSWVEEQTFSCVKIDSPSDVGTDRIMLNGNEAIAMGALAAGCNFLSFYPMTPATTVATNLILKGRALGLKYEQVEDEIAAINMAIGASYAGAKAIVSTSGGGFALMVEAISLAGVSETPLVSVVVQRPGPATGMATRTEQADLNLVLYAGHGEFPRAIFAPGTIEECFYLTHRAFDLAEQYQTPIFVLSDQYLADSYRAVEMFDIDSLPEITEPLLEPGEEPYLRYKLTEDGVSPRLIPGFSEAVVRADSHEHSEDCIITEDAQNRVQQNSKRLSKAAGLHEDVIGPDYYGEEGADILLMCWGSSLGACLEASELVENKTVAVLHFKQVYPLREEQFMDYLEKAGEVVSVEGNATGQFARLVTQETGFTVGSSILRFDGRTLTPQYIIQGLNSII